MKINCLGCGHRFDLGDSYDDFDGLVKCPTCAELLHLRSSDGSVRAVMPASMWAPPQYEQSSGGGRAPTHANAYPPPQNTDASASAMPATQVSGTPSSQRADSPADHAEAA